VYGLFLDERRSVQYLKESAEAAEQFIGDDGGSWGEKTMVNGSSGSAQQQKTEEQAAVPMETS